MHPSRLVGRTTRSGQSARSRHPRHADARLHTPAGHRMPGQRGCDPRRARLRREPLAQGASPVPFNDSWKFLLSLHIAVWNFHLGKVVPHFANHPGIRNRCLIWWQISWCSRCFRGTSTTLGYEAASAASCDNAPKSCFRSPVRASHPGAPSADSRHA